MVHGTKTVWSSKTPSWCSSLVQAFCNTNKFSRSRLFHLSFVARKDTVDYVHWKWTLSAQDWLSILVLCFFQVGWGNQMLTKADGHFEEHNTAGCSQMQIQFHRVCRTILTTFVDSRHCEQESPLAVKIRKSTMSGCFEKVCCSICPSIAELRFLDGSLAR